MKKEMKEEINLNKLTKVQLVEKLEQAVVELNKNKSLEEKNKKELQDAKKTNSELRKLKRELKQAIKERDELSKSTEMLIVDLDVLRSLHTDLNGALNNHFDRKKNLYVHFKEWMQGLYNGFKFNYYGSEVSIGQDTNTYYLVWVVIAVIICLTSIGISSMIPIKYSLIICLSILNIPYIYAFGDVKGWWSFILSKFKKKEI